MFSLSNIEIANAVSIFAFLCLLDYVDNMYSDLIAALTSKKEMLLMRLKEREDELEELTRQESVRP